MLCWREGRSSEQRTLQHLNQEPSVGILLLTLGGTLSMGVTRWRVLTRSVRCGSLMDLWTGRAAFILGSTNDSLSFCDPLFRLLFTCFSPLFLSQALLLPPLCIFLFFFWSLNLRTWLCFFFFCEGFFERLIYSLFLPEQEREPNGFSSEVLLAFSNSKAQTCFCT